MEIGKYLRELRSSQGLSARQLSDRVGVHVSYASRVERGKAKPSREYLSRVAGQLRVSEPHLLSLGGFMPSEWSESIAADGLPSLHGAVREGPPSAYGRLATLARPGSLGDPLSGLFEPDLLVSPELNEVYELRLAMLEASRLSKPEILQRGAYFVAVGGEPTNHYRICTGGAVQLPRDAGNRLRSFLATHHLKSSYATHGLFPYRGKFHPQMVKAIINVMGVRPGGLLLDPMSGSGTTSVEASIMGIHSVSVDASPFCTFMAGAKVAALSHSVEGLREVADSQREVQRLFTTLTSEGGRAKVARGGLRWGELSADCLNLALLAFLDATGYATRSSRNTPSGFFHQIVSKYAATVSRFQKAWKTTGLTLGTAQTITGDARKLNLEDDSVDGILFSPPYSFAIDYVDNDLPHLQYMGVDVTALRETLVGLRGKGDRARVKEYFSDMEAVLSESHRVLRPGAYCTIVIGSNSNQLSKALGISADSPEARLGLETRIIEIAADHALSLQLPIRRLIVGMANTMREEHILFFRKEG
jgi:transcriptional regulator with XRE-family HTH domain